jgi:hypothetical protein
MKKKQWDAISDERHDQIWCQIRAALNPGHKHNTPDSILDNLSPDESDALFNRLCCDYGRCVMFGSDSNRKNKLLLEFEKTLELMYKRRQAELLRGDAGCQRRRIKDGQRVRYEQRSQMQGGGLPSYRSTSPPRTTHR